MKCFTISETNIYDGIPVVDGGIGMDGKVAVIADGKAFPRPVISIAPKYLRIAYFWVDPKSIILRADYFRYTNENTTSSPIIFDDGIGTAGALVLWIVNFHGPNYFDDIWAMHQAKTLVGPIQNENCFQYLFKMENEDASIMVKPKKSFITLHYSHGILKLDKDPK